MNMDYADTVRRAVCHGIADLAEKLDGLEQTTHGRKAAATLDEVLATLKAMWERPCPYTVSDFTQAVGLSGGEPAFGRSRYAPPP